MKRVGLLSDTHSYLDERIFHYFEECDEVWHAGDIGMLDVTDKLAEFKPLRAVYGNIDDHEARLSYPKDHIFELEGVKVWMTHIGGYPPRYTAAIKKKLAEIQPRIFICGHSHILKVIPDKTRNLLHINPGAAGKHGFHQIRTCIRFTLSEGNIQNLEVIELGKPGTPSVP